MRIVEEKLFIFVDNCLFDVKCDVYKHLAVAAGWWSMKMMPELILQYIHTEKIIYIYMVRCRYNAVMFLQSPHKRHPIARPNGRAIYRVYFVCLNSDLYSAAVIVVVCAIPCNIRPRYNGTCLYTETKHVAISTTEVDKMTNSGSGNGEIFVKMTFPFQYVMHIYIYIYDVYIYTFTVQELLR